jgi:glyoxylase-like metal-dependent hydrolase (beta-lactamase superfamily II)
MSSTQSARADFEPGPEPRLLQTHDILCVRASNPGPYTLSGTNSWLAGRSPTWLIDPGPLQSEHVWRLGEAIEARGGLGGIALTHDHRDHTQALAAVRAQHPAPVAAGSGEADVRLSDGMRFGPLQAVATPGHAPDHFALVGFDACFSGDAVLGEGSVFVAPYPSALVGYLDALRRLRERGDFSVICPGHGPVVWDPLAKLDEYVSHREERERRLLAALGEGLRSTQELLDAAWSDVPAQLRAGAQATLAAHLDKLASEGALPAGVARPAHTLGDA